MCFELTGLFVKQCSNIKNSFTVTIQCLILASVNLYFVHMAVIYVSYFEPLMDGIMKYG